MKKIITLLFSILLLLSFVTNSYAFASKKPRRGEKIFVADKSKYIFYEDFSSVKINSKPTTLKSINEADDTEVSVVKTDSVDGSQKRMLKIDDRSSSGNVIVDFPAVAKKGKTLIETRFMFKKTTDDYMSFGFDLLSNSQIIGRVIQWSSGGAMNVYSNAGVNTPISIVAPVSEEWYTMEILYDGESGTFDVQLVSDAMKDKTNTAAIKYDAKAGVAMLKGTSIYPEAAGMLMNTLRFQTTSKRGEFYIEYVKISSTEASLEYKGAKPIPLKLPMGNAPVLRPLENTINVNFKGEYLFFTYPPYEKDGKVYVPAKTIASAYGLTVTHNDDGCTIGDIAVVDINKGTVTVRAEVIKDSAEYVNGAIYVSVIPFAEAMGDTAEYNGEVIIKE